MARAGFLAALECGEMRVMTIEIARGWPTARRYTKEGRDQAVRLVFELRKELGTSQETVVRIAEHKGSLWQRSSRRHHHRLGDGPESISKRFCQR